MSKIEWCNVTWNPITGCEPISEACQNCYANRMANRLKGRHGYPKENPFHPGTFHKDKLNQPKEWEKPKKIFVGSMGDIFHDYVAESDFLKVYKVMEACPQHTFILLTKRPINAALMLQKFEGRSWPLPNVWLGVTCENQKRADERIDILLRIPAAKHFVSFEPLLGFVNIAPWLPDSMIVKGDHGWELDLTYEGPIDWVVCGGETGPNARPMHPDWVKDLQKQCEEYGARFFFKHWGEYVSPSQMPGETYQGIEDFGDGIGITNNPCKVGKKQAGRLLNGQEYNEFPL